MRLLDQEDIFRSLDSEDSESLFIEPLLERSQIGEATIDIRLGYDFLASIRTRRPYVSVCPTDDDFRSIGSYFQITRRQLGDRFVVYPGQIVLTTSLEYVALPANVYADVLARSS